MDYHMVDRVESIFKIPGGNSQPKTMHVYIPVSPIRI